MRPACVTSPVVANGSAGSATTGRAIPPCRHAKAPPGRWSALGQSAVDNVAARQLDAAAAGAEAVLVELELSDEDDDEDESELDELDELELLPVFLDASRLSVR